MSANSAQPSRGNSITIPSPITIPDTDIWSFLLDRRIDFPPDKVLFTSSRSTGHDTHIHTFTTIRESAARFGQSLIARWSWRPSDVLAVFAPNCVDYPVVVWGTLWANGVVLFCNPAYGVEELAFQLRDAGARAIVTTVDEGGGGGGGGGGKRALGVAREAARRVEVEGRGRGMGMRVRILVMGESEGEGGWMEEEEEEKRKRSDEIVRFGEFVGRAERIGEVRRRASKAEDVAYLVYSSGTTGLPKGVMLTHRNIVAQILQVTSVHEELSSSTGNGGRGDVMLAVLPFFHIFGLMMLIHHPFYNGLGVVVLPEFSLSSFCDTIQEHRVTFAYVVPPILLALSKSPETETFDFSSLRTLMSGAAPLTQKLIQSVTDKFRNVVVKQGYGLSEASPGIAMQARLTKGWETSKGSCGPLLPHVEAKFMSHSGEPVPKGSSGEIWVRGPNVFLGYLKNPAASQAAVTKDGWYRTGDAGYQDDKGNLYITDRIKELVKYKGFQVAPAELEGILVSHSKVADACVVGLYDESEATEVPRAFVVLTVKVENAAAVESEIQRWVQERVVSYKRLRGGVELVDQIPKTASGKVLRRVLKDRALEKEKRQQAGNESSLRAKI